MKTKSKPPALPNAADGRLHSLDAFRASEIRYRRLFETAHDGVLLVNPGTRKIVDANPFMTKLLGYTHKQLVGREMFEIGLLKDEAASREMFRNLRRKHEVRYEDLPLEGRTGRHQQVEVVANLYQEDGHSIIQCNIRDITERKLAEAALRASEERYRVLFQLGPVAVYSCDAAGVIQNFNRRAVELWGRKPKPGATDERFCGSAKMFRTDGSLLPHARCPMAQVLTGKISAVRDQEVIIERPDHSRLACIVNIRVLKNEKGRITGAINCFYDITERKAAAEAQIRIQVLAASNKELTLEIAQRKAVEAALKKEASFNTQHLDRDIARTQRLVEKSVNLVHDFARELRPAVLDDLGLIPALHSFVKLFSKRTRVHVRLQAFAGVEALDIAKRTVLFRVAQEALTNVSRHAQAGRVEIDIRKIAAGVGMKIKDDGKSFSVERELTKGGKRLGLLGMRERVQMVGGTFRIESAPGKGTSVMVEIPSTTTPPPKTR